MAKQGPPCRWWEPAGEPRNPWTPTPVAEDVATWLAEAGNAELLAAHGERVMPLLLAGETRCGKTSSLCGVARKLRVPTWRLPLARIVGGFMGQTASNIREALREAADRGGGLWIIDEIDGIAPSRNAADTGAAQERNHAVACLLTELDALPSSVMLAATSNVDKAIDPAVLSRFTVVRFPKWEDLVTDDRKEFAASHGDRAAAEAAGSYAEVVQRARRTRVQRILGEA